MSRNYPPISVVKAGDQFLMWSTEYSTWVRATATVVLDFIQENFSFPEVVTQYNAPMANDFSVQIGEDIDNGSDIHLILTPNAGYAAGTLVLPINSSLQDKQTVLVNTTQAVTALTIDGNGAINVIGEPTTLAANDYFTLKYDLTMNTWYRVG